MARRGALWHHRLVAGQLRQRYQWICCLAALMAWIAWGWPALEALATGATIRNAPVSPLWLVPFAAFGAAALGTMAFSLPTRVQWGLLGVQFAAVTAITLIQSGMDGEKKSGPRPAPG